MHLSSAETYPQKHNHTMSNSIFWVKKDIKFQKKKYNYVQLMYTFIVWDVFCVHKCWGMKSISQNQEIECLGKLINMDGMKTFHLQISIFICQLNYNAVL